MKKPIRQIRIEGNIAYVPLTNGYEAMIDAQDVPLVDGQNWCAHMPRRKDGSIRVVYAVRNVTAGVGRQRTVRMHRLIMGELGILDVDHHDSDGLNNRRSNLRWATASQNQQNQRPHFDKASGVKGVYWNKDLKKWHARIKVDGAQKHLGYFVDLSDAASAYNLASIALYGEFSRNA